MVRPMRNLKEARVESAAQTQVNLRKAGSVGEEAETTKPNILYVNGSSIEGERAEQGYVLTWGRPVGYVPETCNYDINLLSAAAMLSLWSQGVVDLFVVVIKQHAYENMAIYLRIKHDVEVERLKAKGQTH